MKYFLLSDDKSKILVYEYSPIQDKIYEYKKAKLDKRYVEGKSYMFEPGPYNVKFHMAHPNSISEKIQVGKNYNMSLEEFNEMVRYSVCNLDFHNELINSDEERKNYVEAYASGKIELSMWTCLEAYPKYVNVNKYFERLDDGYSKFIVGPVFMFGPELMMLIDLEEGHLKRAYYYPNHVDTQFECFNFYENPIDEVNISTLELLIGSANKVINLAEENANVLEKAGIRVRK